MILPPKTTTTAQIDYLTISGKRGYRNVLEIIEGATGDTPEPRKGLNGFEHRLRFNTHAIDLLSVHQGDPERVFVVLPGTACQILGQALRRTACDLVDATDGRFNRIDTAIDLRASEGDTFDDLFDELEPVCRSGSLVGESDRIWAGPKGTTCYFGSTDSARMMRIYDKGKEQGLQGNNWIRFEAQFTKDVANAMTSDLVDSENWTKFAQGATRGCFPQFELAFPTLAERLFASDAYRPELSQSIADLDNWIRAVQHQFGGRIQMMADLAGLDPYEVARRLDLFETKPTKRLARHSGFLACAMARLDDIIMTDDQTETNQSDQGQGSSRNPADGDQALCPEHRVAE